MRKTHEPDYTPSIESRPNETGEPGGRVGSMQAPKVVEPLDQTKSEAVANLVHDLRTPLVSIRGYTRMILEERVGPINSTQREYLSIVAENADKAVRLLNELLK